MAKNVLLIGYGSIGKRHAGNLLKLGATPYVLTRHPDGLRGARFIEDINECRKAGIAYCIIASPTGRHLNDFKGCASNIGTIKKVLIEKPVERSYSRGSCIADIARRRRINVSIGYNIRFIKAFDAVRKFINNRSNDIKIVEIVAGQDLRQWRPDEDTGRFYSAHRRMGGGVDLDLSHEIDYALWLFGRGFKHKLAHRARVSDLDIDSPDIFKLILDYRKFIVDITLDYIRRPKERYLKIICGNGDGLHYDLVSGCLKINGSVTSSGSEVEASYLKMLRAFLGMDRPGERRLCGMKEGLDILDVIGV